jgi:hypothetical protein
MLTINDDDYFSERGFFIPGNENNKVGGSSEFPLEKPDLRMI